MRRLLRSVHPKEDVYLRFRGTGYVVYKLQDANRGFEMQRALQQMYVAYDVRCVTRGWLPIYKVVSFNPSVRKRSVRHVFTPIRAYSPVGRSSRIALHRATNLGSIKRTAASSFPYFVRIIAPPDSSTIFKLAEPGSILIGSSFVIVFTKTISSRSSPVGGRLASQEGGCQPRHVCLPIGLERK